MSIEIKDRYKYRSVDIATYILAYANEERIYMNITKLQKLLYIVYGIYLALVGERLIDEKPQAWPYGPVFPITRLQYLDKELTNIKENFIIKEELSKIKEDKYLNRVIRVVFKHFGDWNASKLTAWSHMKNSPWEKATNNFMFSWGDLISDQDIYSYFKSMLKVE